MSEPTVPEESDQPVVVENWCARLAASPRRFLFTIHRDDLESLLASLRSAIERGDQLQKERDAAVRRVAELEGKTIDWIETDDGDLNYDPAPSRREPTNG